MFGKKEYEEKNTKLEKELKFEKDANEILNARIDELIKECSKLRDAEIEIKRDYLRKEEHATALMKVNRQEAINEAVTKVKDEYATKEKELLSNNFEKLSTSMTKLHEEGNRNSQYQEKMTLKMMDVIGSISSGKTVDSSKLIENGVSGDSNKNSV